MRSLDQQTDLRPGWADHLTATCVRTQVWDGFQAYGSRVPWRNLDRRGLRDFLIGRVDDGYAFPLNPKWILCDEGWIDVFRAVQASPHAAEALHAWLPPESGLLERINDIARRHPHGFRPTTDGCLLYTSPSPRDS